MLGVRGGHPRPGVGDLKHGDRNVGTQYASDAHGRMRRQVGDRVVSEARRTTDPNDDPSVVAGVLQRVADQVGCDLTQSVGITDDGHRLECVRRVIERRKLYESVWYSDVRVPYRLGRHTEQVDRLPFDRPLLVESSE